MAWDHTLSTCKHAEGAHIHSVQSLQQKGLQFSSHAGKSCSLAAPRSTHERLNGLEFLQACRQVRDVSLHAQQSGSGPDTAVTGTSPRWLLLHDVLFIMSGCQELELAFCPQSFRSSPVPESSCRGQTTFSLAPATASCWWQGLSTRWAAVAGLHLDLPSQSSPGFLPHIAEVIAQPAPCGSPCRGYCWPSLRGQPGWLAACTLLGSCAVT